MTCSLKYTKPSIPRWTFLYNLKHNIFISQLISQLNILTKTMIVLLVTQDQQVRVILDSFWANSC